MISSTRQRIATGVTRNAMVLCLLLAPALTTEATPELLQPEEEELLTVDQSRWGEIRIIAGTDWSAYDRIILETATVSFRKNWERDQRLRYNNQVREKDIERITEGLASQLDEIFRIELTETGNYSFSDTEGAGVMRITPAIVDLDIIAPDRMRKNIGYAFADSKGRMTLELQISDSVSDDLLAHMTDSREDPRRGYFEWTTTIQNRLAARDILWLWARRLGEWLEEQSQSSPSPTGN